MIKATSSKESKVQDNKLDCHGIDAAAKRAKCIKGIK